MANSSNLLDPTFPRPIALTDDIVLWWLGQAGFAIRSNEGLTFIDPYLSDVLAKKYEGKIFPHIRMHDSPVDPTQVEGLTTVLCTHGHTDHMDLGCIPDLQKKSSPIFVIPRSETSKGIERGINPTLLVGINSGERFKTANGIKIYGVPAAHESLSRDEFGQDLFMGFVIEFEELRIYHSGDCTPYENQIELLSEIRPDVALLPVNGRDSHRASNGVPGNFTFDEAVELCRAVGIKHLVCHHWGLFEFNTASRDELAKQAAQITDINCFIPDLAEPFGLRELLRRAL